MTRLCLAAKRPVVTSYIKSRQLPGQDRLDDTTKKSLKVEYWVQVQIVVVSLIYNSYVFEISIVGENSSIVVSCNLSVCIV